MKQRRTYTPPRATLLDCDGPELLANSNINFANPDPAHPNGQPYDPDVSHDDNINPFQEGEGLSFDIEW